MSRLDPDYLRRLQRAYRRLCEHVEQEHDTRAVGTAGQVEAAHQRAHTREGTPWHSDAWWLEPPAEEGSA